MNRGIWVVLAAVVLVAIGLFVSQSINGPAVPLAPAATSPGHGAKEAALPVPSTESKSSNAASVVRFPNRPSPLSRGLPPSPSGSSSPQRHEKS
jgi:hypothetical protein